MRSHTVQTAHRALVVQSGDDHQRWPVPPRGGDGPTPHHASTRAHVQLCVRPQPISCARHACKRGSRAVSIGVGRHGTNYSVAYLQSGHVACRGHGFEVCARMVCIRSPPLNLKPRREALPRGNHRVRPLNACARAVAEGEIVRFSERLANRLAKLDPAAACLGWRETAEVIARRATTPVPTRQHLCKRSRSAGLEAAGQCGLDG